MQIQRYIYVGTPGECKNPLKSIEDTPESRLQTIEEGYTAFSTMSFAYEPNDKKKPESVHYGDLWLDIDCKEAPFLAVVGARDFFNDLVERYKGVNPEMLDYFMSGSKGVHIRIPAEIFGGENGHPCLPKLHRRMLEWLFQQLPSCRTLVCWR